MNRQEQRALREIERNLAVEDPALAELLRSPGPRGRRWLHRCTGALAVLFLVLALVLADLSLMLMAGLLAVCAALTWAVQAVLTDERDRRRRVR